MMLRSLLNISSGCIRILEKITHHHNHPESSSDEYLPDSSSKQFIQWVNFFLVGLISDRYPKYLYDYLYNERKYFNKSSEEDFVRDIMMSASVSVCRIIMNFKCGESLIKNAEAFLKELISEKEVVVTLEDDKMLDDIFRSDEYINICSRNLELVGFTHAEINELLRKRKNR